jgi:hypothetical protein
MLKLKSNDEAQLITMSMMVGIFIGMIVSGLILLLVGIVLW